MKNNLRQILFIVVIIFLFCTPLFLGSMRLIATPDFGRSDSTYGSIPFKLLLSQALKHKTLPIWNPDLGMGFPLLAQSEIGTFYLPNIFFFALFDFAIAYNLNLIFSLCVLGIGLYFFIKHLGLSKDAAILGSLVFTLSGGVIPHFTHYSLIQALSLFPWVLYFGLKLKGRNYIYIPIFAIVLSQQIFAGFAQAVLISLVTLLLLILFLPFTRRDKFLNILKLTLSILLAFALSAAQLLPSLEFSRQTFAAHGFSQSDATHFSYPLVHLTTLLNPFALGNPKTASYPFLNESDGSIFWENVGFFGLIPFFFFVWLIFTKKKNQLLYPVLAIMGIGLLLMLGKHSPLYFIFSFWPFNLFRVPSRFIWTFLLGISLLAALGCEEFYRNNLKRYRKIFLFVLILVHAGAMYRVWWSYHLLDEADKLLLPPKTAQLAADAVVYSTQGQILHNLLLSKEGWNSAETYRWFGSFLIPNLSANWSIPTILASSSRPLARTSVIDNLLLSLEETATQSAAKTQTFTKVLETYGTQYYISKNEFSYPNLTEEFSDKTNLGNLYMYKLKMPVNKAYLAEKTIMIQSTEEGIVELTNPEFRPGKTVLIEDEILKNTATVSGEVVNFKSSQNSFEITIQNQKENGLLVLNQTFYPGWKAYINNLKTEIYPVNIRYIGIKVPMGESNVKFEYDSASIKHGILISVLSYIAVLGLILSTYRKKLLSPLF